MAAESRRLPAMLLPAGCALAVAALASWTIAATSQEQLREYLRVGQFWFLDALFIAMLCTSVWAGRHLLLILDTQTKRMAVGLACIAGVLVFVTPRTNRI